MSFVKNEKPTCSATKTSLSLKNLDIKTILEELHIKVA